MSNLLNSSRFTHSMLNLAIGLAAALFVAVIVIRVFENRFIYFPPRFPVGFEGIDERYGAFEEVWITASDGVRLNGIFIRNRQSSKVLLSFHGNAENVGQGLGKLQTLSSLGASAFAIDYRGYGKSEGSPNEAGVYRDAAAAYRYLLEARGFQPGEIFVYGNSLGGAVAIDLASRAECAGLIAESTFTSAKDMARAQFLVPLIEYVPKSRFDSLEKIKRVRCPVLIIHGTEDRTVPYRMGERLFAAAPGPKRLLGIRGAGHNNVMAVGGEEYLNAIREFLDGRC